MSAGRTCCWMGLLWKGPAAGRTCRGADLPWGGPATGRACCGADLPRGEPAMGELWHLGRWGRTPGCRVERMWQPGLEGGDQVPGKGTPGAGTALQGRCRGSVGALGTAGGLVMPECEKERKGGKGKRRMAERREKEAVRGKKRMRREGRRET